MAHLPLTINATFCKDLWPDPRLLKADKIVSTYTGGASAEVLIPG